MKTPLITIYSTKLWRCLAVSLLVFSSLNIYAAPVSLIVKGVFDESTYHDDQGVLPFPKPAPGTIFTLRVTYDSSAVGFDDADLAPNYINYRNAVTEFTLDIGNHQFNKYYDTESITIFNNLLTNDGYYHDIFSISADFAPRSRPQPGITLSQTFGLNFWAGSMSQPSDQLTSTDLIVPTLEGWEFTRLYFSHETYGDTSAVGHERIAYAQANITSITAVPLPAAAWLFGSALIGLIGFKRRK